MPFTKTSQVNIGLEGNLSKGPLTYGFEDYYPAVQRVILKESLVRNEQTLKQVPLEPLNCSFGVVKHEEKEATPLSRVIRRQLRDGASDVSIVFAVRRPACGNCREHGRQLREGGSFCRARKMFVVGCSQRSRGMALRKRKTLANGSCPCPDLPRWIVLLLLWFVPVGLGLIQVVRIHQDATSMYQKKPSNDMDDEAFLPTSERPDENASRTNYTRELHLLRPTSTSTGATSHFVAPHFYISPRDIII